jgi:DNA (cytosine-5)-methyltransferase 1
LSTEDIRKVRPEAILEATGLKVGELDAMEGSPPCASFSTAGKREKHWGKAKKYSDTVQRVDDLFFEYVRLLRGLQPKVFVAENVSGLVKGVAKGYFLEILGKLKACGYRVGCRVLDAQWLGVPQARQRTIFIGVREDLGKDPVFPKPLPYRYSLRDALPWIVRGKYGPAWRPPTRPAPRSARTDVLQPGDEPPGPRVGRGPADGRNGRGVRSQGEVVRHR